MPEPDLVDDVQPRSRLRSAMTLELHTDIAHDYVRAHTPPGSQSRRQPGLQEYCRRVYGAWIDASHDNPLADWILLRVEDDIEALREAIATQRDALKEKMNEMHGQSMNPATSDHPYTDTIQVDTPFGYLLGVTLGEFDWLVREAVTAAHIGAIRGRERTAIFQSLTSQLRRVLMTPHHYTRTRSNRDSVPNDIQPHIESLEMRLGASMPEDVFTGERRASFAPDILTASESEAA